MTGTRAERQLRALGDVAQRVVRSTSDGTLVGILDAIARTVPATAVMAFSVDLGLRGVAGCSSDTFTRNARLVRALEALARRSLGARRPLLVYEIQFQEVLAEDGLALAELDAAAAVALPVEFETAMLGVLVLLLPRGVSFDGTAMAFLGAVTGFVALTWDRRAPAGDLTPSEGASDTDATRADADMLSTTVVNALRGPLAALSLQVEEQREVLDQLDGIERAADSPNGDLLAQLMELTNDVESITAQLGATLEQIWSVSEASASLDDIDLGALVREQLAVARPLLERRGITTTTHLEPSCTVRGRHDQLGQVVQSFLFHAAEASLAAAQSPAILVQVQRESQRVVFTVTGNGPPVPEDTALRWFSALGAGTAAGGEIKLRLCADVVTAHGGHVEVAEAQTGGNSMRVVLPSTHAAPHLPSDSSVWTTQIQRSETKSVLVVDDDPVFLRTVRRALKPHEVRSATTASEAEITLFDSSYAPDLILCDIFLPGANGDAMHARIAESRPELAPRFVFITGGALSKTQADYLRRSGCPILLKPADLTEIARLLEYEHTT